VRIPSESDQRSEGKPIAIPIWCRSRFRPEGDHRSDLKPITHGALEDGPPTRASAAPG